MKRSPEELIQDTLFFIGAILFASAPIWFPLLDAGPAFTP